MKLIAGCVVLIIVGAGCGGAHLVAKPTPPTSSAPHVATSDAPATVAATSASEQNTCSGSKPHTNVNALDVRRLHKPVKLFDGQLLLYPTREQDRPTLDAPAALHPHDGAGNPFNAVYEGATPVLVLARFTYVISIANPKPVVDRLAWIVLSNCVLLQGQGPGANPPFTGYSVSVVDATTGLALMTVQTGPPLDVARIGLGDAP